MLSKLYKKLEEFSEEANNFQNIRQIINEKKTKKLEQIHSQTYQDSEEFHENSNKKLWNEMLRFEHFKISEKRSYGNPREKKDFSEMIEKYEHLLKSVSNV